MPRNKCISRNTSVWRFLKNCYMEVPFFSLYELPGLSGLAGVRCTLAPCPVPRYATTARELLAECSAQPPNMRWTLAAEQAASTTRGW